MIWLNEYLYEIMVALSRLSNTLAGGSANDSLSLRCARSLKAGKPYGCIMCKILDFFHQNHCLAVAWRNNLDDMPPGENLHVSDLVKATWLKIAGYAAILLTLMIANLHDDLQ